MANKLAATITVDNYMLVHMDDDEVEDYVHTKLRNLISNEVMKHVDIATTKNLDSNTFTATLPIGNAATSGVIVGSSVGYNGTFTNNHVSGIITKRPELRVMEYTKNGKVTRVELQYYDGDDWIKVPRHQLEE